MTDGRQQTPVTAQFIRLPRESISGALIVMQNATRQLKQGNMFHASYTVDLGNAASADILLTTPNTAIRVNFFYQIGVETESHVYFYENPTISNVGTAVASYNRDRNSSATATMTVKHTPTVTDTGAVIPSQAHLGTKGSAAQHMEDDQWILKQNEEYLLRVTNATALANYTTILLDWYEA